MINYRLSEDQLTAYLKTLKAGRKSLDAQGKKLLDALFFYQDRDGDPDYDWTRIAIHFRQERRGKICTAEDVLPPALYPVLDLMMGTALREDLVDMARHLVSCPYTMGYYRRLIRSRDYHQHAAKIWKLAEDLILQHCEEMRVPRLLREGSSKRAPLPPEQLALWLDRGDEEVLSIVHDMLVSENNTNVLTYDVFRAIFKSNRTELVELVGKLLLAGRLQEGLRQAICETMDCGRQEHFVYMMGIIEEHNLIRFSSVRRAIATTIGIGGDYADRIDKKQLALMLRVLRDPQEADVLLRSADNMEAMVGLWYKGSCDLTELMAGMEQILTGGRPHSVLLVSYFLRAVQDETYERHIAKRVLAQIADGTLDADAMQMIACYLPYITGNFYMPEPENFAQDFDAAVYFKDKQEAIAFFALCARAMEQMKRKEIEYRPCIFPWYGVTLTKDALAKAMVLAALSADGALTDRVAPVLPLSYTGQRAALFLLDRPKTAVQEAAVIELLRAAPETATRIMKKQNLVPHHRADLAALLRLKTVQVRRAVLDLLYTQEDVPLLASIEELLTQKDVNKRLGALDLLLRCKADGRTSQKELLALAHGIKEPTSDEQVLIEELAGTASEDAREKELYDASYRPDFTIDIRYTEKKGGIRDLLSRITGTQKENTASGYDPAANTVHVVNTLTLADIFPRSDAALLAITEKLNALYTQHEDYEYKSRWQEGEETTLSAGFIEMAASALAAMPAEGIDAPLKRYPLAAVWEDFYEKEIKDFQTLHQLFIMLRMPKAEDASFEEALKHITGGRSFTSFPAMLAKKNLKYFGEGYGGQTSGREVIRLLHVTHAHKNQPFLFAAAKLLLSRAYECFDAELFLKVQKTRWYADNLLSIMHHDPLMSTALHGAQLYADEAAFAASYALRYRMMERLEAHLLHTKQEPDAGMIGMIEHAKAQILGMVKKDVFYQMLLGGPAEAVDKDALLAQQRTVRTRLSVLERYRAGTLPDPNDPGRRAIQTEDTLSFIKEEGQKIIDYITHAELRRGDSPAKYSGCVNCIQRVEGIPTLVRTLQALGKLKLDRGSWYYGANEAKASTLSHLLKVCHPRAGETASDLKAALAGTGIKEQRLIETAMYAPQWIPLIEAYLGWRGMASGCYYFQAHMSDIPKDREGIIARYTPIAIEDLKAGAFDIDWFRAAYKELGKAHFDLLYESAKYISDGAKHARARKFADAVRGKMKLAEVEKEIKAKRNKDLVMSYGLIPMKRAKEKDMLARYQFLQNFLKESKQFGAQRRASEAKAVEIALSNLARNCGFTDVTRLVWAAETGLMQEFSAHFTPKTVEGTELWLSVSADGKASISCTKNGKPLKALPAKLKKHAYVLELKEAEKNLREQYSRSKKMLEEAMEDGVPLLAHEIANIMAHNPVIAPLLRTLVFKSGSALGFYEADALIAPDGTRTEVAEDAELKIAHALDLYESGTWAAYQAYLFEHEIKQPFKQVFRELYVKTADEHGKKTSLRYAGHQIQPAKTVALLKTRRWVVDGEEGLQRIYYKANIIARIYALADWFSPADIEAPTLEWVDFFDRKTFKKLPIDSVPDLIFTEVMRDVDLVVSVAHVGGVDPEASHSTIEMRRAIASFNLPLFKLDNVRLEGSHAHIHGTRGDYTVHLGSGVVQQKAGAMLNVLPVHSQHRGRLFLPFLDEDPKTAEIMSKIILFAEDGKIKDPFILEQIQRAH